MRRSVPPGPGWRGPSGSPRRFRGQSFVDRQSFVLFSKCQFRLEDVKKLIWPSFRDFGFVPKCMPTPQRSLTGHPRAICFAPNSLHIFKSIFSHPPDHKTLTRPRRGLLDRSWPWGSVSDSGFLRQLLGCKFRPIL